MLCTKCQHWVHKRCFRVHGSLTHERDFTCKKCIPGVLFEDEDKMITLDGDNIEVMDRFSYLGDVSSTEGGVQKAVTSRIRSAWKKFKEVSNVVCGRSISLKVRGTLYKSYVRNALTYGAECWALKMEGERRLKTTEMRMLRMVCGKTLKDKMNNEKIREMTGVVRLEEFLREKRLRWLRHVERMDEERGPVKALLLEVNGTKKGRPKKRWKEVVECDMTARGLQRLDAQDRERWRLGCKNQLPPASGFPRSEKVGNFVNAFPDREKVGKSAC